MRKLNLIKNSQQYYDFIRLLRIHPENTSGFQEQVEISQSNQIEYMKKHGSSYYICTLDDTPVGFIGSVNNDLRLATDPKYKRMGIGKFMLESFLEIEPNCVSKVLLSNQPSNNLFKNCGLTQYKSDNKFNYYKKTKNLVITRSDQKTKAIEELTLSGLKSYADKCNADFKILSGDAPVLTADGHPHYRIVEVRDLLDEYDRVLCLDLDMIVSPKCPNIFGIVPENMIGSIYEDKGSRATDRRSKILNIQKHWGDVNWSTGYTNAGTFLVSKMHKDIFLPHNGKYWLDWGSGDLHLSYNIHKLGFKIFELEYKWNHMTMFSEPWNNNANRFESNIIHYAGVGVFDRSHPNRISQIKSDISRFEKE
jgi:hypothetical protein